MSSAERAGATSGQSGRPQPMRTIAVSCERLIEQEIGRLVAGRTFGKTQPRRSGLISEIDRVYFVEGPDGSIKIGHSRNVSRRVKTIQALNPTATLLLDLPGGIVAERDLHQRFAKHRLDGEWFRPAPELLALIASHRSTGRAIEPGRGALRHSAAIAKPANPAETLPRKASLRSAHARSGMSQRAFARALRIDESTYRALADDRVLNRCPSPELLAQAEQVAP